MEFYDYKLGYPQSAREDIIKQKLKLPVVGTHPISYKGQYRNLPVINVPIELPIYRLKNVRTKTMQEEYLADHEDLEKDYFQKNDSGSIELQTIQHSLLRTLIQKENLKKNFEDPKKQQTTPLICSSDGIVVNGNRRLCAWRELYELNSEKYSHFQEVSVAVLPDSDEKGMYDLEVELQISPDLKADYMWHAIAADCKEKSAYMDNGEIAKKHGKSASDIATLIDCYDYAQEFLSSIGKNGKWSEVDEKEYAFKEIVKARKKLQSNTGDWEVFNEVAKAELQVPSTGDRLYNKIKDISKYLNRIITDLSDRLDYEDIDSVEILPPLDDDNEEEMRKAGIAKAVVECADPKLVSEIVDKAIENCKSAEKEVKDKNYVFEKVKVAASALTNAIQGLEDTSEKRGVEKQLDSIEGSIKVLRDWLKK